MDIHVNQLHVKEAHLTCKDVTTSLKSSVFLCSTYEHHHEQKIHMPTNCLKGSFNVPELSIQLSESVYYKKRTVNSVERSTLSARSNK